MNGLDFYANLAPGRRFLYDNTVWVKLRRTLYGEFKDDAKALTFEKVNSVSLDGYHKFIENETQVVPL